MKKAVFNWSGGKDSALALKTALESGQYEIVSLLTTISSDTGASTMHHIPAHLLRQQAESIGIPLYTAAVGPGSNLTGYEQAMKEATQHFLGQGVSCFIFGDIHLHDIRKYREEKLTPMGIEVAEPLWELTPAQAMETFLDSGLQTIVTTVTKPDLKAFIGRSIDREFVRDYPPAYDLCGEEGEYHTFCHDGSIFAYPVAFQTAPVQQAHYTAKLENGNIETYTYWYSELK